MPDTFTPKYNLTKPEVGASRDAWGSKWNANADIIDAAIDAANNKPGVLPGTIIIFATPNPPTGYLKCNGAWISRAAYASLFAAIGTQWGAADGVNYFALPDLRGEFPRFWDDGRGLNGGRGFGTVEGQSIPDHNHETNMGQSGGNFNQWTNDWPYGGRTVSQNLTRGRASMINEIANYTVTSYTSYTMNGNGAEIRPRNIALLACIKY